MFLFSPYSTSKSIRTLPRLIYRVLLRKNGFIVMHKYPSYWNIYLYSASGKISLKQFSAISFIQFVSITLITDSSCTPFLLSFQHLSGKPQSCVCFCKNLYTSFQQDIRPVLGRTSISKTKAN